MAQGESPAPFFDKGLRQASLFVCLPTPFDCLYLFTYRPRPMQANEKRCPVWASLKNYPPYKITPAELLPSL